MLQRTFKCCGYHKLSGYEYLKLSTGHTIYNIEIRTVQLIKNNNKKTRAMLESLWCSHARASTYIHLYNRNSIHSYTMQLQVLSHPGSSISIEVPNTSTNNYVPL